MGGATPRRHRPGRSATRAGAVAHGCTPIRRAADHGSPRSVVPQSALLRGRGDREGLHRGPGLCMVRQLRAMDRAREAVVGHVDGARRSWRDRASISLLAQDEHLLLDAPRADDGELPL